MSSASNFLENKLLDHALGTASYTKPTSVYVALFHGASVAANLEANIITDELSTSGTGYSRKLATFGSASTGIAQNNIDITFDVALTDWGTIDAIAVVDISSGAANVLFWGIPSVIKTINTSDIYQIKTNNLTITLD